MPRSVLESFFVSRLLLLGLTMAVGVLRHQSPLQLWDQWDSKWYLGIAIHGYHWTLDGKSALAFFPLYPLLVRLGTGLGWPAGLAGLVLSNFAFVGALFYVYGFTSRQWGPLAARRAVWLVALFPTAFFTFAPYSEALFLLCAAGALYHAGRHQPLATGLWVAAALLTRSTGLVLLPAILVALEPARLRSWILGLAPTLAAAATYAVYLASQRLSLWQVPLAQRAWHRGFSYPWMGFMASLDWLGRHGLTNPGWATEDLLQLGVTAFFLLLTVVAWRQLGRAAAIYCAAFWLLVLSSPEWRDGYYAPFSSMDRIVLALFPLAGWAAARLTGRRFRLMVVGSALLMLSSATVHVLGGWVG